MNQINDSVLTKALEGEEKLYDLQKEELNNVRTMIVASATIASVDLLAFSALKEAELDAWFLLSVALLYITSVIYALYLTYTINLHTKNLLSRSEYVKKLLQSISGDQIIIDSIVMKGFADDTLKFLTDVRSRGVRTKTASFFLGFANLLFVIALLIPIIGLAIKILS